MAGRLIVAGLAAAAVAGCGGGGRGLGDGSWYGAVTDVDSAGRTIGFAVACRSAPAGGWFSVARRNVSLTVASGARFTIYYRPNGDPAAGHSQPVGLRLFRQAVRHGGDPDFPAGWIVTTRNGQAVSVEEDSGVLPLRVPACS